MTCGFMRLATLQFERKLQKCIRMGINIFKISFGEVYRRIYIPKSSFTAPLAGHVKCDFRPYIPQYTSPNENFEYSYPLSEFQPRSNILFENRKRNVQNFRTMGKLLLMCLIFCYVWVTVTVQQSHHDVLPTKLLAICYLTVCCT